MKEASLFGSVRFQVPIFFFPAGRVNYTIYCVDNLTFHLLPPSILFVFEWAASRDIFV